MRELTRYERQKIRILTENSISFTLIEPTKTGLKKSIMDATGPVRNYMEEVNFHNYREQLQGTNYRVAIDSVLLDQNRLIKSIASLYRPKTKKGDPRIWFRGLRTIANPNDILCIIAFDNRIYVINLTQVPLEYFLDESISNPIIELIQKIRFKEGATAMELLGLLRGVAAAGPIKALVDADTAVGRTLEYALGIDINSSKKPDYKGIELKSFRNRRANRKNLFAQVADWSLSKFKSSAEILDAFGYSRGEDFKLYCTVSAITRNSQGLKFKVNSEQNWLVENSEQAAYGDFAVWPLKLLRQRLLEKHNETFWISTDSVFEDGKEYFQYKTVEHTREPKVGQFDFLLEQGVITMDHLIKRNFQGKVVEKGPLFKIKPTCLGLLFPPSLQYDLII